MAATSVQTGFDVCIDQVWGAGGLHRIGRHGPTASICGVQPAYASRVLRTPLRPCGEIILGRHRALGSLRSKPVGQGAEAEPECMLSGENNRQRMASGTLSPRSRSALHPARPRTRWQVPGTQDDAVPSLGKPAATKHPGREEGKGRPDQSALPRAARQLSCPGQAAGSQSVRAAAWRRGGAGPAGDTAQGPAVDRATCDLPADDRTGAMLEACRFSWSNSCPRPRSPVLWQAARCIETLAGAGPRQLELGDLGRLGDPKRVLRRRVLRLEPVKMIGKQFEIRPQLAKGIESVLGGKRPVRGQSHVRHVLRALTGTPRRDWRPGQPVAAAKRRGRCRVRRCWTVPNLMNSE